MNKFLILNVVVALLCSGCANVSQIDTSEENPSEIMAGESGRILVLLDTLNWFVSVPPTHREDAYLPKGTFIYVGEDVQYRYYKAPEKITYRLRNPLLGTMIDERIGEGGIYLSKTQRLRRGGIYVHLENDKVERLLRFDASFFRAEGRKWKIIENSEPVGGGKATR